MEAVLAQFRKPQNDHGPTIKLVAFDDIRLGKQRRYLVKGLLPRVGLSVVWGPPKSGKSFWTFDVAMHVALGWDYRGRRVHQGPVIYCAFEGQIGIEARVEAFRQRFLAEDASPVPFYLEPVTLDLVRDHAALNATIQALDIDNPVLVVLDTLNRSLRGSESSDEDMTAYVRAADAIREKFNCAVVVVHHGGIAADRPRGHTSLTGAADAQLAVKRDANNNVVVTVEWMKDGPEGDAIGSRLDPVEVGIDEDGELITSCLVVPAEAIAAPQAKIPDSAKMALRLLNETLAEVGAVQPASSHIPPNTRTCTVEQWRRYCYAGTITESDHPDSKQKAFVRASKALQAAGIIGVWNDQVWIAGHAGHSRT
jgi:hypothetical protein